MNSDSRLVFVDTANQSYSMFENVRSRVFGLMRMVSFNWKELYDLYVEALEEVPLSIFERIKTSELKAYSEDILVRGNGTVANWLADLVIIVFFFFFFDLNKYSQKFSTKKNVTNMFIVRIKHNPTAEEQAEELKWLPHYENVIEKCDKRIFESHLKVYDCLTTVARRQAKRTTLVDVAIR